MNQETWRQAGVYAFYAFTGASLLFAFLYGLFSPWWRTPTGRNIMTLMSALGVAGGYFTWSYWEPGPPRPSSYPIRFFIFLVLFLAVAWRVVLFVREQLLARRPSPRERNTTRGRDS